MFLFPRFPKHQHREAENEEEDESLSVHLYGTGSLPPACHGPQRHSRCAQSHPPLRTPCLSSASFAYSEQLGWKRQAMGSSGAMNSWYPRTSATRQRLLRSTAGLTVSAGG